MPFRLFIALLKSRIPFWSNWIILALSLLLLTPETGLGQKWSGITKIGIGGYYDRTYILSSKTDENGNTYILGTYDRKIILGDKEYVGPNYLKNNFYITKLDPFGQVLWSNVFNGERTDRIYDLTLHVDKAGYVFIQGFFSDKMVFSEQVKLTIPKMHGWSTTTNFVCRYSKEGIPLWAKFIKDKIEVNDMGEFYSFEMLHNGFTNYVLWRDFDNAHIKYLDTLRHYNTDGELIEKYVNSYPYIGSTDNSSWSSSKLLYRDHQLWLLDHRSTYFINKFSEETGKFIEVSNFAISSSDASSLTVEILNGHLYLFGSFRYSGTINLGGIEVVAQKPGTDGYYRLEGFLYQYNMETKSFDWGQLVNNTSRSRFLTVSQSGKIYLGTELTGGNAIDFIQSFDSNGDFLWQLESKAYIMDYVHLGIDKYENVYVSGGTFNGLNSKATFGDYFYLYDYDVGFLAKIQPGDCSAIETNVAVNICNGDEYKIGNSFYNTPGVYTSNLLSVAGCDSTVTVNLTVTKIEASIKQENGSLKAIPDNASYQWVNCNGDSIDGATSQFFLPLNSGFYSAFVKVDGCVAESECAEFIILDYEALIEDKILIIQTENQIILTSESSFVHAEFLRIYTSNGRLVSTLTIQENNSILIEKSLLAPGFYILHLSGKNYFRTIKIITT